MAEVANCVVFAKFPTRPSTEQLNLANDLLTRISDAVTEMVMQTEGLLLPCELYVNVTYAEDQGDGDDAVDDGGGDGGEDNDDGKPFSTKRWDDAV